MRVNCPHCHNPIEIVDDSDFTELSCPSCGSRFSLFGDGTDEAGQTVTVQTLIARPATSRTRRSSQSADSVTVESLLAQQFGHFELLQKLGAGAFGTVWKAYDAQLDRTVAIKIPRSRQLSKEESEKFLREARAAAQLRHPNIVSVHEVGREGETVYIVSDYIAGRSLDEWLKQERPSFTQIALLCVKIADALQHAHDAGVIHRDLKPSNIMIDGRGEPHIMDFGLAKREAGEISMTVEGCVLGTPAYMSPEQARGEGHRADRRSDVYALGVVLFELLTGERPFRGSVRMLLQQVLDEEPPNPHCLNRDVPRDLEVICLKCLQKEPGRRYATARDLSNDLKRFLNNEPIRARPVGRAERLVRWCRRNPALAGLSAAIVAALLAGTIVSSCFAVTAQRNARQATDALDSVRQEKQRAENAALAERHARQQTRRYLYVAHMNLAQQSYRQVDPVRVDELLNWHLPKPGDDDLRGFGWYYLWRLSHRHAREFVNQFPVSVNGVAISPDGRLLAACDSNKTITVWDLHRDELKATLNGHHEFVSSVAFSPNGHVLASGSWDRTVRLWDPETGECQAVLYKHRGQVTSVAFSPDGRWLASGGGDLSANSPELFLWDHATRQVQHTLDGHTGRVTRVRFSADGGFLASAANDGTIRLWKPETGEATQVLKSPDGEFFQALALSPDGKMLASGSFGDAVELWDLTSAEIVARLEGHQGGVYALAFSPDAGLLASGGPDRRLRVWDVPTRTLKTSVPGHSLAIAGLAFAPDGRSFVSCGWDHRTKVWRLADLDEQTVLTGHENYVEDVAFSPDGRTLASASIDGTIRLWNVKQAAPIRVFRGHTGLLGTVAFSPDGTVLASGTTGTDGPPELFLWNVESDQPIERLTGHRYAVSCVAFSPDGRWLASAGGPPNGPGELFLWNRADGLRKLALKGHDKGVEAVAFSPDGRTLASTGIDGLVCLWDLPSGRRKQTLRQELPYMNTSLDFSPDGRFLAVGSTDNALHVWDLASGECVRDFKGHTGYLYSVAFHPDGRTLASAGDDGTIRLWNLDTGEGTITLKGRDSSVWAVDFSPDGTLLASGGNEGTVRLWRAATPEEVRALRP